MPRGSSVIFLSVGTQLAFDRLVRIVDEWAVETDRDDVIGQIGVTNYVPQKIRSHAFIGPSEFKSLQASAQMMISHAGMGAIFGALESG
jgi:UDP-N-acetylglucosamine transferase subunit ALG13